MRQWLTGWSGRLAVHNDYADIRSKIAEQPLWWDENGVPRYCEFHPSECANIYAREAVLFLVTCQGCSHPFQVALTSDLMEKHRRSGRELVDMVGDCSLHYGDPPNIRCCPAGPTMNSEPRSVVSYWRRDEALDYEWRRDPAFDGKAIVPDWVEENLLEDWDIPKGSL